MLILSQIYPSELHRYKVYTSDAESTFLDLRLFIYVILFQPKFMITLMILILELSISYF